MGKVTIKDVAKEAGVSISTVSNALNGVDVLLPETKRHILEVAERLQYIPNLNGRNLKAQATRVIGLFLSSIKGPYYGVLADSIYDSCVKNGYELQIFMSTRAENIMTNILGRRVDGAIVLNGCVRDGHVRSLMENDIPVVYIDREISGQGTSSVVFDSYREGEQAAGFLLELGHRRFIYIQGVRDTYDNDERRRGFETVLNRAGLSLGPEDVLEGNFEKEAACRSMKAFLRSGRQLPDAVFAANDLSAIGVMEALTEAEVEVPGQVSVMGCDDIETAKLVRPSLTTVATSFEKQGAAAVEQLVALIKRERPGSIVTLSGRIVERESTGRKK